MPQNGVFCFNFSGAEKYCWQNLAHHFVCALLHLSEWHPKLVFRRPQGCPPPPLRVRLIRAPWRGFCFCSQATPLPTRWVDGSWTTRWIGGWAWCREGKFAQFFLLGFFEGFPPIFCTVFFEVSPAHCASFAPPCWVQSPSSRHAMARPFLGGTPPKYIFGFSILSAFRGSLRACAPAADGVAEKCLFKAAVPADLRRGFSYIR